MPKLKRCSKCKVIKNITAFGKDGTRKSGLRCWCRDCDNKENRNYYHKNKQTYTVTIEKCDEIEQKQKGLCIICGLSNINKSQKARLVVDHNHNSGAFRGLLCHKCNLGLGYFNVDNFGILNLQKAVRYINENNLI